MNSLEFWIITFLLIAFAGQSITIMLLLNRIEQLNGFIKRIDELEAELSKHQESSFHPDWSLLQASQESLREHMGMIKRLDELENDESQHELQIAYDQLFELAENYRNKMLHLDAALAELITAAFNAVGHMELGVFRESLRAAEQKARKAREE